jgi:opacity protein-like surface antigen
MKSFVKNFLVTGFIVAAGTSAHAEGPSGIYIGAGVGPNFQGGGAPKLTGAPGAASVLQSSGFNTGARGDLSLGWAFGNGLRAEIEGTFTGNNAQKLSDDKTLAGSASQRGEAAAGVLANTIYEFSPPPLQIGGAVLPVKPYLGAGFGYVTVYRKNIPAVSVADHPATYNYTKGALARQLIAGVAFPVAAAPGLDVTLDYRLLEIASSGNTTMTAAAGGVSQKLTFDNRSVTDQSILLGVRYTFGG